MLGVVIKEVHRPCKVLDAFLANVNGPAPSLVLANTRHLYICDFHKFNKMKLTTRFSTYEEIILTLCELRVCWKDSQSTQLLVLTSANMLYVLALAARGGGLVRKDRILLRNFHPTNDTIDVEKPILIANDRYTIVHSVKHIIAVISSNDLGKGQDPKYNVLTTPKQSVLDIKFVSKSEIAVVARNASFQYTLSIYQLHSNKSPTLAKEYNPFKEVPRAILSLPGTNCTLVLSDSTHLVYPPLHHEISKKVVNPSVKLTRVSVFKTLNDEEFEASSVCPVDADRTLIVSESGDLYLQLINLSQFESTISVEDWQLVKLGRVSPSSKVLHITENLFLNYSDSSLCSFFRIVASDPYINIIRYFNVNDFSKSSSILKSYEPSESISSIPVIAIERIPMIGQDLFLKLQSCLTYSCISMPFPAPLKRTMNSKIGKASGKWLVDADTLLYSVGSQLRSLSLSTMDVTRIYSFAASQKIIECLKIGNNTYIVTENSVISLKVNRCVFEAGPGTTFHKAATTHDEIVLLTNHETALSISLEDLEAQSSTVNPRSQHEPGIISIHGIGGSDYVRGFGDGSIFFKGRIKVSSQGILDVVEKDAWILALDAHYNLYKVEKDSKMVEMCLNYNRPCKIINCESPDEFLIQTDAQISLHRLNEDGLLDTVLLKIFTIPDAAFYADGKLISFDRDSVYIEEVPQLPKSKLQELYVEEMVKKVIILRSNKSAPLAVLCAKHGLKLLDLETFTIIDEYPLSEQEAILDIYKASAEFNDEQYQNMDITEKEAFVVEEEIRDYGILVNVECEDKTMVRLFTVGVDVKFKFHYMLISHNSSLKDQSACAYHKLLNINGINLAAGFGLTTFHIQFNDKWTSDRVSRITDDNYVENSIVKLVQDSNSKELRSFAIDLIRLVDNYVVVLNITGGFTVVELVPGKGMKSLQYLERKAVGRGGRESPNAIHETVLTAAQTVDGKYLLFSDVMSNLTIYEFSITPNHELCISLVNRFKLTDTNVNCITSLELKNDHICIIGCTDGSVLMLDAFKHSDRANLLGTSSSRGLDNASADEFIDPITMNFPYIARYPGVDMGFEGMDELSEFLIDTRER